MRRIGSFLGTLTVAASMLAWTPSHAAQTVKVGVILSFSGQGAASVEQMDRAIRLYMKTHEKELGDIKLELIRRDDTGPNPDLARRLAQELITREKVDLLTGFFFTPNINAVAPLANEAKIPVVIMNAATSSTVRLSPYLARTSLTQWQQSYPLGQWAAKQGIQRAYTAVTDYAPGHDAEQAFSRGFTEAGGKIVGSVRMPLKTPDFTPFLQRIKDEKPEALFIFVPGAKDATAVMKVYSELGLAAAGVRLVAAGDCVPDDELPNMGDVPTNVITMGFYSSAGKRPQNEAFVASWKSEYGKDAVPSPFALGAWDGMAAIFHVVKQQNGKIDPERTMQLLKGWRNDDSPRGPVMIDPETRDVVQNMYVRRLERVDGKLANVEIETIPMVKDPWPQFNPPK
ncbi:MAG TPA: ABC transporter substrate-binding protein [Azospirillum sp.]|nr:ABC transporter substrate-binding protein [Azospirillum sp.]